jgi:eukaryotic-like serine/threonine-protein kinase
LTRLDTIDSMAIDPTCARTERFEIAELLGRGASGSVYRAFDRQRGEVVALKILSVSDPSSLFRFKGEFRALTNVKHNNLLELYELVIQDDQCLLTMELVEGRDFLDFVRPRPSTAGEGAPLGDETECVPARLLTGEPDDSVDPLSHSVPANDVAEYPESAVHQGVLDVPRLRSALRQMCEGLNALHDSGRIHRDLKPANVLVFDVDGRLVICDFGLVVATAAERHAAADTQTNESLQPRTITEIAGTMAYMSPEQASGERVSEAGDYYAIGVMLYQALTGRVPFDPRLTRSAALRAKREQRPADPRALNPEAPADLAELALALLDPDPATRPKYAQVVRVARARLSSLPDAHGFPGGPEVFVGRVQQLAQLDAAFAQARTGLATVALVSGYSGMGKSSTVRTFLSGAVDRGRAIVLAGRCYEREQLPHKAFDPIVDSLSEYLLSLDDHVIGAVLPATTPALARLFPVLLRVPHVQALCSTASESTDPTVTKRHAYAALREILHHLALRRPLILYIDDLQWGDLESGPWFTELLRPPQPPPLLLLCAYRAEDASESPLLVALRNTHLPDAGVRAPVSVTLGNLTEVESHALARAAVTGMADAEEAAALVVREGGGSPFFLRMFADYVRARGATAAANVKLADLLSTQIRALSPEAHQLLSVVATAGRPEQLRVAYAAAGLTSGGHSALRALEAQRLVQATGVDDEDRVEVCHDRIRETAYRLLTDGQRTALHRGLGETLARYRPDGAEALLRHWREAGDRVRAGEYALKATKIAEDSLAFGRAAELLSEVIALLAPPADEARRIEERRARALVLAGRGVEAAEAFFRAIEGVPEAQAIELRMLATTQLLRSGCIAQAYAELERAQATLGLTFPKTTVRALGMLLWRRIQIWFLGLRIRRRRSVTADALRTLDMLWAVASSLSAVDHLRGSVYQATNLLLALKSGEPYRMACALATECTVLAANNRDPARTQRVIDRGLELAGFSGDPHSLSAVKGTAGICRMLEGRFREAVRLTRESQEILRDRLNATLAWDNVTQVFFELQSTALLGNVGELVRRVPDVLRDAEERGDIYAATCCRTFRCSWAWLGQDAPHLAREQVAIAERQWSQAGYHLQHYYTTHALVDIGLYEGNVDALWERIQSEWSSAFFVRQIQHARVELTCMRARVALTLAAQTGRNVYLEQARADARALVREGAPWTLALGRLVEAGVLTFEDRGRSASLLKEVEGQFEAVDMKLHAQAAAYRRGQLVGGSEGEAMKHKATSEMVTLGAQRPAGFVRILAPGAFVEEAWSPRSARD